MRAAQMTRRNLFSSAAIGVLQPTGYETWSWERWRQMTGERRPEIASEQTGRAQLSELSGKKASTAAEWPALRAELRRVVDVFLGQPSTEKPPLEARTEEEVRLDGGTVRRRVRYQGEAGEWIPAYLFVPAGLKDKAPAVVCPHQTTQDAKDEPAGLRGNPRLAMALALARRGFVTISYDALCFGARHDPATGHYGEALAFYGRHPKWSMMGKMAWDLSRAVDYLSEQRFVDAKRIGSIGHSHGGYTTWCAMALDERIAAGVSSCGFDTFRHDGNPYRWSHATALLPRLGFYVSSPYIHLRNYSGVPDSEVIQIPFDLHWVLALIAPRPLLLTASDDDNIFPNSGWSTRQTEARLRPVYTLLGAADDFDTFYFRGGHGFPPESEQRAFTFLERRLGR